MALVLVLIMSYHLIGMSQAQLQVGFYSQTCPEAESTVRSVVQDAIHVNPRNASILLRLHFHDCFVEGCDGSILIDNGANAERHAPGHVGLEGFEVIAKAKENLESVCKGVVSCADIVALAARDAVSSIKVPFYEVPTGRRDGRISDMSLAANMPEADDSIQLLKSKFTQKGLSHEDLVLLSSGAHTIGTTACFFLQNRLYNFSKNSSSDPAINPRFLRKLEAMCPPGNLNDRIPLDPVTKSEFDDQILRNIRDGFAVIASDARLNDDNSTKQVIESYINNTSVRSRPSFKADFAEAMVKMGNIGVKTGSNGEIRRACSTVN
ncbi:peroxidase 43-like [Alnus glutinosa]|uniref:peroxidase 43-like n=1 Tax=Alnus glutinosa TaxID=3517 RepID=UPI002D77D787|nr:peroxidase 43-like [Alnus glutinosa]